MLARYVAEIEDRQQFIDGIVEAAGGRDLTDDQLELVSETRNRIAKVNELMGPLEEARRISGDSAERIRQLAVYMNQQPNTPREVEYRSAGEYICELWRARLGTQEAQDRLEIYHRAASHQTTADNAGLIPTPILGPVVDFIDSNRALVTQLGPRQLPGQTWSRPLVTQHTSVAVQSAEKAELVSQKMTITKLTGTAATYGGYVNVSRQDVDFTTPGIMDLSLIHI